jgi:uncharacterized SAM-binding protein YcdF (DUF218 family)
MSLFSLEKALGLLVMPVGLIWLLLLAGAGFCLRRRQRGPAAMVLAMALLYGLAGNRYLASALVGSLERRVAPVDVAALQPFDAVFVLGGGSEQDAAGAPELGLGGDRIFLAARLWHAGKARLLVASGASRDGIAGFRDGGQETRALWQAVGIPDRAILVVPEPCWNTRDEIQAYARLQARYRWQRMALVSSASHLPRAMALASRAGLAFTPLGADRIGRRRGFELQGLVPQGVGFETSQRACWEYLGRWLGR